MTVNLRALIGRLNQTTRTALEGGAGLCLSRTHYDVEIEHLLLRLLESQDSDLQFIVRRFGVDQSRLAAEIGRSLDRLKTGNARTPSLSPYLIDALAMGWLYGSIDHGATKIRSGFVVVALLSVDDLSRLARDISPEIQKIDVESLRREFAAVVQGSVEDEAVAEQPDAANGKAVTGGPRVFVSYRHDDSQLYADFLFTCLRAEVPDVRVFRDSDTLQPGMVYPEKIDETIAACDILLAIIGKKWAGAIGKGGARRIDLADDWVRLEVAAALRQKKVVIPCLVGGARMPANEELPPDLAGLAVRQAVSLSQTNLRRDAEVLMESLRGWRRPES